MIGILGDTHGNFVRLRKAAEQAHSNGAHSLIQVGDFGYYAGMTAFQNFLVSNPLPLPVYWIDGNHEEHEHFLDNHDGLPIQLVNTNCWFIPRGSVLEVDGRTIAFMGGASSIDKKYRITNHWHWSPLEDIRYKDMMQMDLELASVGNKVDMMITHVPPQSVIAAYFDPRESSMYFGVPLDYVDPNAKYIESLWQQLGYPPLYCGHMHRSITERTCTILNIDELIYV